MLAEVPAIANVPWRAWEWAGIQLGAFAVTIVLGVVLALFVSNEDLLTTIAVVMGEVVLGSILFLWLRLVHRLGPKVLGFARVNAADVRAGLGVGLAGLGLAYFVVAPLVTLIAHAIAGHAVTPPKQIPLQGSPAGVEAVLLGFGVVVLAPIFEEALFRGFLYRSLRKWLNPRKAMLLSAVLFGLVHFSWFAIPAVFVLGLLLARVVERRGNLIPAITAHMLFNLVGFTLPLLIK